MRLPQIGEQYALAPGKPARRTRTGRSDLEQAIGRDWQNAYADFATSLKRELAELHSNRERDEAIARMREVLRSYEDHRAEEKRRGAGAKTTRRPHDKPGRVR